jgi:hypothetical protein
MSNVAIPESFPKITFSKADVEAEQKLRRGIPGCISSVITESAADWILTSVYESVASAAAPDPG